MTTPNRLLSSEHAVSKLFQNVPIVTQEKMSPSHQVEPLHHGKMTPKESEQVGVVDSGSSVRSELTLSACGGAPCGRWSGAVSAAALTAKRNRPQGVGRSPPPLRISIGEPELDALKCPRTRFDFTRGMKRPARCHVCGVPAWPRCLGPVGLSKNFDLPRLPGAAKDVRYRAWLTQFGLRAEVRV